MISVVLLVPLLGACSDDDTANDTTTTVDATDPPTTTTAAPPASAAPAAPACPEVQPLSGDGQAADVDGDGQPDEIRASSAPDGLILQVELGAGGGGQLAIPSFGGGTGLIGAADVDDDGADEVWVRVGSGASAAIVGLVRFADCALTQVVSATGGPVELPVGGSVGTAGGVACASAEGTADLTTFVATNIDETTYEVTTTEHAFDGSTLTPLGSTTSTVSTSDPDFVRYGSFACDDLAL